MAVGSETISLKPLEAVSGFQRYQVGVDLSNAVISNGRSELGGDADALRYPFLGIFRLGRMARAAAEQNSSVDVVSIEEPWPYPTIEPRDILKDNVTRLRASGIARAWHYDGSAPLVIGREGQVSTRFNYWLRQADGETPEEQGRIGATVLTTLIERQNSGNLVWSAISPYDIPKRAALEMTGFEKLEDPKVYPQADGQEVTLQLWHKHILIVRKITVFRKKMVDVVKNTA